MRSQRLFYSPTAAIAQLTPASAPVLPPPVCASGPAANVGGGCHAVSCADGAEAKSFGDGNSYITPTSMLVPSSKDLYTEGASVPVPVLDDTPVNFSQFAPPSEAKIPLYE